MAFVRNVVRADFYKDSMELMKLSEEARHLPGVKDAAVVMATSTNKELLERLGLLTKEGRGATENDMLIAVNTLRKSDMDSACREIGRMLAFPKESRVEAFGNVDEAIRDLPDADLAIVSIPGEYARDVVKRLLDAGIHVQLFSDHVSQEDETYLKKYASRRGLFVLGPGAGTSIIRGKAIAFANVVRRGRIGIVAAAGTGLQEVSVLVSRAGAGISQGLGVGGGDVGPPVGGIMSLEAVRALEADPETEVVCIVSKPPSPAAHHRIMRFIEDKTRKKYVVCFLGRENYAVRGVAKRRVFLTKSLHLASIQALRLVGEDDAGVSALSVEGSDVEEIASKVSRSLKEGQKYVRGLYSGGTLMFETMLLLSELVGEVHSNAPLDEEFRLSDSYASEGHTVVDLGEEEFTAGRAHPMIDPSVRKLRIVQEAKDPSVAVIIIDVILGYGSNRDPAGAILPSIIEAKAIARRNGRELPIFAHVCGTDDDPQPLNDQEAKLAKAGVVLFPTNALMAMTAALVATKGKLDVVKKGEVMKEFLGVRCSHV